MRLALITPRYGAEITHGPEHVCRLLAERLSERHDVDVLTTCARDEATWKNVYPEGADRVRGVLVRRFAGAGSRDGQALESLADRLHSTPHSRADELEWVRRSGSSSPALVDFLKRQHRNYDALVFFSYCAGTTVHGMAVAPERSILFPGAAIDPTLRLMIAQETIAAARGVGYSSAAERRIVRGFVRRAPRGEEIVGIGVDPLPEARYPRLQQDAPDAEAAAEEEIETLDATEPADAHLAGRGVLFRRRHRLHGPFVLYGGRVEANNGTEELIEYFASYADQDGDTSAATQVALVVMGIKLMKLPSEPWLRLAGVLPERDRLAALESADVVVAPDPNDMAGEQALESLAVGTPVLASALNLAAVEHCRKSNAGLYYRNRDEFIAALTLLMTNGKLRNALGRNGQRYVQQHYRWDAVVARFEKLVSKVRK